MTLAKSGDPERYLYNEQSVLVGNEVVFTTKAFLTNSRSNTVLQRK